MVDIDKVLDERKTSGTRNWWNPDDEGETLQGYVKRITTGQYGKSRYDVDDNSGDVFTTPSHNILVRLLEDENVKPGDYIKIFYEGLVKTQGGQAANNYSVSVVHKEEFDDLGIDPYSGSVSTAPPKKASEREVPEKSSEPEPSEEEGTGTEEITKQVIEFVSSLMDHHDTMEVEELDRYLNNVRDFGVDAEEAAIVAGFSVEDGIID